MEEGKLQGCPCESRAGEGVLDPQREAQGIFQNMPSLSVRLMSLALRVRLSYYYYFHFIPFGFSIQREPQISFIQFLFIQRVTHTLDTLCHQVKNDILFYLKQMCYTLGTCLIK